MTYRANGNYVMESEPGDVSHYAAKVLCRGDGNELCTPEEAGQVAVLFAAAPDMLAKLEEVYDFIDDHHHLLEPHVHTVLDELEQLMDKARGRPPKERD